MPAHIKISTLDREKFEWVRNHILEDLTIHHTIDYLSAKARLNTFKLKNGFKLLYGETLYDFLQNRRLSHAIQLLSHSEESIQVIAERCGYGYATNFIAAFKRKYKIRPTDFRKVNQIKAELYPASTKACYPDHGMQLLPRSA
jgi:AraC-like DNA-binding protein